MHSFLVAALFMAMVLGPCVVAMFTGVESAEETQPAGNDPVIARGPAVPGSRPAGRG